MKIIEEWYLPDSDSHFSEYFNHPRNKSLHPGQYQKVSRDQSISLVSSFRTAIDIGACVGFWSKDLC